MGTAYTQLIPIQELAPGAVGVIRNSVINGLLEVTSKGLGVPKEDLIIRDVNPVRDLQVYSVGSTDATIEDWVFNATTGTGWVAISDSKFMGDMRYVALFGVRDLRRGLGPHATATVMQALQVYASPVFTLVRIGVGGAYKTIWDTTSLVPYTDYSSAFSPSAVIIPQNSSFDIDYYKFNTTAGNTVAFSWLQLIGVTCEPRGRVISP